MISTVLNRSTEPEGTIFTCKETVTVEKWKKLQAEQMKRSVQLDMEKDSDLQKVKKKLPETYFFPS